MTPGQPLLDPPFLRQLERLSLVARKVFAGHFKGERRSSRRGTSQEFADYRNYVPGDDLRYLDWNSYARLEKLFLKLFMEEEELVVYLLVDGSNSMTFGEPAKFDYARRIAAALGYVGLANFDRVGGAIFADSMREYLPPLRGRAQVSRFFRFLEEAQSGGKTSLSASLREYALRSRRPGMAVVVSDLLDPDWEEGLKILLFRRFQTTVVHVLDSQEVHPQHLGDLKLVDCETGVEREISVTQGLLRDYQRAVERFCGSVETTCHRYGADYLRVTTDMPFEDLVLRWLRTAGVVR